MNLVLSSVLSHLVSEQFCQIDIIIHILQMKKSRLRKGEAFNQDYGMEASDD